MMWLRTWQHNGDHGPRRKLSRFIDRDFQVRYSAMVVLASLAGMAFTVFPVFYFLRQNYRLFLELSYQHAPSLVNHLEQEQIWVSALLFTGFAGLTAFFVTMSVRMTHRIVGPVRVLRNHLRRLTRGHWHLGSVRTRQSDEFQDLVATYNYFYEAFRANLHRDIELLKQIRIKPEDRDSLRAWNTLLDEKYRQLNLKRELPFNILTVASAAKPGPSRDSRHAS